MLMLRIAGPFLTAKAIKEYKKNGARGPNHGRGLSTQLGLVAVYECTIEKNLCSNPVAHFNCGNPHDW